MKNSRAKHKEKTLLKLDPCFKFVNKRLNLSGDQFHKNAISSVL